MSPCMSEGARMTQALIGIKGQAFKGIHLKWRKNFAFKVTPVRDFDMPVTNDQREK